MCRLRKAVTLRVNSCHVLKTNETIKFFFLQTLSGVDVAKHFFFATGAVDNTAPVLVSGYFKATTYG